jgi:23S rRNA pseudouridine2605 synthase
MALERLQKILASAGIASRRKAEELITSGRISVNGETITTLGSKADLDTDDIRVDGTRIQGPQQHLYIMLYKPREFVTTVSDPEGRPTVMNLVRDIRERVFPVGRLDYNSEGLLLLTNDGDLMQQLTAPTSHVPKTYLVKVSGQPTDEDLNKLRAGIKLPAEPSMTKGRGRRRPGESRRSFAVTTLPSKIGIVREGDNPWYEITLTEGRNRQIRRMFEEIGHHVEKIKRVRYGPLTLNVEPGHWRLLAPAEVSKLRSSLKKPMEIRPPRKEEELGPHDIRKLAERVIGKSKQSRPRREWPERPPKREFGSREHERGEKRPRREFGAGRPRREVSERPPKREFGSREREDREQRPRREFGAGRPPREFGEGRPRREDRFDRDRGSRRDRDDSRREDRFQKSTGRFSKGPRREGSFGGENKPKRQGDFTRGPRREGGPPREGKRPSGFGKRGFGKGPRPGGRRGPENPGD